MSLTTPTVHVPDTSVTVPGWVRRHLVWMLIAVAVFATAALVTFTIIDSDSDAERLPHTELLDRGSINAVEHGGTPAFESAPARSSAADALVDRSITAIDRQGSTAAG